LLEADVVLADALVDMYSKCGIVSRAHRIVEQLRHRDVVAWNVLIGGYAQQGSGQEAFRCLRRMQIEGLSPDAITFTILSKACAGSRSIDKGELIHVEVSSQGLLARDVPIGNALIEMYARCGRLGEAQRVMEELLVRDVVSWNTLIARYTEQGQCERAMACFRQMQREGISPDSVTLLCVLSACSRSGHLLEAEAVFGAMRRVYGIDPKVEHCTCMVLAFGCGGQLDKAMSVIDEEEERMPASAHLAAWFALLGVCRKWGNLELARLAFGKALGA
jgi:pentatricopeptide repeat protein